MIQLLLILLWQINPMAAATHEKSILVCDCKHPHAGRHLHKHSRRRGKSSTELRNFTIEH